MDCKHRKIFLSRTFLHILMLICLFFSLLSCTSSNSYATKEVTYQTFQHLHIRWENFFLQPKEHYVVYVYSPYCRACYALKKLVFGYFLSPTMSSYFLSMEEQDEAILQRIQDGSHLVNDEVKQKNIGVKNLDEIFLKQVPCLFFIKDGSIVDAAVTYTDCVTFFEQKGSL